MCFARYLFIIFSRCESILFATISVPSGSVVLFGLEDFNIWFMSAKLSGSQIDLVLWCKVLFFLMLIYIFINNFKVSLSSSRLKGFSIQFEIHLLHFWLNLLFVSAYIKVFAFVIAPLPVRKGFTVSQNGLLVSFLSVLLFFKAFILHIIFVGGLILDIYFEL